MNIILLCILKIVYLVLSSKLFYNRFQEVKKVFESFDARHIVCLYTFWWAYLKTLEESDFYQATAVGSYVLLCCYSQSKYTPLHQVKLEYITPYL